MLEDIHIGDVVKLKGRYKDAGNIGLVIDINKSEWIAKKSGWVSFDFVILNERGEIMNVSGSCVSEIINSNQSPSTWLPAGC